jgi:hypothetical protein
MDYIPKPDREAQARMSSILVAMAAAPADYGLTAVEVSALQSKLDDFSAALDAADAAKSAAQIAVSAKDNARATLEAAFRPAVQRIQVNPAVTDASRTTAGIPVRDTVRTVSSPVVPVDLVATGDASGFNSLKWKSGGNAGGVQYVVEGKAGSAPDFSLVDVTSATTFKHTGVTVGQQIQYRIKARRGAAISTPSNVATVY